MGTKGEAWVYPNGIPVGWTGKSLWQSSTSPHVGGRVRNWDGMVAWMTPKERLNPCSRCTGHETAQVEDNDEDRTVSGKQS